MVINVALQEFTGVDRMVAGPVARGPLMLNMLKGVVDPTDNPELPARSRIHRQPVNVRIHLNDVPPNRSFRVPETRHAPLQTSTEFGVLQEAGFQVGFGLQ